LTVFVDTGYFIAVNLPRDALHRRAVAWIAAIREPLVVTEYVLWETINGLSKPNLRERAHEILEHIETTPNWEIVEASPGLFQDGLTLHRNRPDKAWSLTDCISFIVMEQRQITRALTPDRHFEQAGFDALLLSDPE
jgi:uncharacterized protein